MPNNQQPTHRIIVDNAYPDVDDSPTGEFVHPVVSELPPIIDVQNLFITFNNNVVLRDLSLTIQRGETVAVIGESGCGKTVFLKTLIGLLWANEGRVLFNGNDLRKLPHKRQSQERMRFGFVFQQAALFDSMTIGENISFPLEQHTFKSEDEIEHIVYKLLSEVGLPPAIFKKKPAELSGGMRKRAGFARALAMEPEIMLYDEPTTGLDPIMSDVINELMINTKKRHGITSVLVTHDMKSARKVADRIIMLYPISRLKDNEPQIVFDGSPDAIERCQNHRVSQFIRGEARERLMEMAETYKPQYPE
jgi:phospholipid/cholesterol/gamma-HCH transport system ATP-binding protein